MDDQGSESDNSDTKSEGADSEDPEPILCDEDVDIDILELSPPLAGEACPRYAGSCTVRTVRVDRW